MPKPNEPPPSFNLKNRLIMHIPLSLYLAATAALLSSCGAASEKTTTEEERIAVKAHAVITDTLERKMTYSGQLTTSQEARYAFKIGGVIAEILVENGEMVRKGQLLARLQPTEIEAGLSQAKLGLDKAERDYQRVSRLYADSVATLEQLQNVTTARDLAREQYESVRFNRDYANIRATADGFVVARIANAGEIAGPGQPIVAVQHTGKADWLVRVGVSDRDWALIREGDVAVVKLEAFPGEPLQGKVVRKQRNLNPYSGALTVEIAVNPVNLALANGLFAQVELRSSSKQLQQRIPYEALIEADGMQGFVFVANGQAVRKQAVTLAAITDNQVWISEGLAGIDSVLIGNSPFLNEQSRITVQR